MTNESVYTVTVDSNSESATTTFLNTSSITSHYCGSTWCNHYPYTYSYWTYPATIYMYQIKCPKCKAQNWLQLDMVTPCKRCASKLKAVSNKADFEIPIE